MAQAARTLSSMSSPPKDACTSSFAGVLLRSSPILKTLPAQRRHVSASAASGGTPCRTVHHILELVHERLLVQALQRARESDAARSRQRSSATRLVEGAVVRCAVLSQRRAQREHELVVGLKVAAAHQPQERKAHATRARSRCERTPSADRCPR